MTKQTKQSGFAAIEGLLIVVIIAIIVGVGFWVVRQNKSSFRSGSSDTSTATQITGTSTGIDEVNQKDIDDELSAENQLAAQEQKDAESEGAALSAAGEGYNVSF